MLSRRLFATAAAATKSATAASAAVTTPIPTPSSSSSTPQHMKTQLSLLPRQISPQSKRTGLLAVKLGMTRDWTSWGEHIPLTILKIDHCYVTQVKQELSPAGFMALQVGCSLLNPKNITKPVKGHLEKAGLPPLRKLAEFPVTPDALIPAGTRLDARHFSVGQYVDVVGLSKGHGYSGPMKRWNFSGQPATHGVSVSHRSHGATGSRQDPGKVFKGKRMAGRWGVERLTVNNLQVYKIDVWNELLFLKGAVPGVSGGYVMLRDAYYKGVRHEPPFPTYIHKKGDLKNRWIIMKPEKVDPFAPPRHVLPQA